MKNLIGFLSGLLFGLGLIISGMTNPLNILNFLDISGEWDISLAVVLVSALVVASVGFSIAKKWRNTGKKSISGQDILLSDKTEITPHLIIGAMIFGTGWGLVGLCPGPSMVMLGVGAWEAFVFVEAMLLGIFIFELYQKRNE